LRCGLWAKRCKATLDFELVIIIGFGSAAGDPMIYKDVGIANALVVFLVIILLYKLTTYLVTKSDKIDKIIEGEPICLIAQGKFSIDNFDKGTFGLRRIFLKCVSKASRIWGK
jgi:uncharacterized membrane protein YcaP (DUF421 family)